MPAPFGRDRFDQARLINIANALTAIRVLLVPLFAHLLISGRIRLALAVFTAKAAATRAALEITSRVFETMGAGAAIARHGYDRYWRNVRTHTLHDPVDYKFKDIGRWLLSGQAPEPGTYS